MTSDILKGEPTASRLEPPLREVFASSRRSRVIDLPVVAAGMMAFQEDAWLRVLDERSVRPILKARGFSAGTFENGSLLGWGTVPARRALPMRALEGRYARPRARSRDRLIGADVDVVHCWNTGTGLRAWSWVPDVTTVESGSGNTIRTDLCADDERVYFGMRDGTIRALSIRDGKEVWRTTLVKNPDPFTDTDREFHLLASEPSGSGSVRDGVAYFQASNRAVALDAITGKHIWEARAYCTGGQLHLDSYHCLGVGGEYEILDARTGRRKFKKDLTSVTPARFHNGGMPTYKPMVVSDTHMFCGYGIGYLLAFERTTGKLVWHHRATPALSFHQDNYFQIVNGRLYTGDYGTMRIYEEVNASDAVLREQRAGKDSVAEGETEETRSRAKIQRSVQPPAQSAHRAAATRAVAGTRTAKPVPRRKARASRG